MRMRDWSSDVCSSDLTTLLGGHRRDHHRPDQPRVQPGHRSCQKVGRKWARDHHRPRPAVPCTAERRRVSPPDRRTSEDCPAAGDAGRGRRGTRDSSPDRSSAARRSFLMYLLDTNVVSELRKVRSGKADGNVARWADSVDAAELFVSAITIHELELGVLLAERKDPPKGAILRAWMNQHVFPAFTDRVLPVDAAVALRGAMLHVPQPRPVQDRQSVVEGKSVSER